MQCHPIGAIIDESRTYFLSNIVTRSEYRKLKTDELNHPKSKLQHLPISTE